MNQKSLDKKKTKEIKKGVRKKKTDYIWDEPLMRNITDPMKLFDLICVRNFMAGNLGEKIPVDESRNGYEKLIKLIKKL